MGYDNDEEYSPKQEKFLSYTKEPKEKYDISPGPRGFDLANF